MKNKNILQIAHERDFDKLEEAWLEEINAINPEDENLFKTILWLLKVHEDEMAELFLAMLLEGYEEQMPGQMSLDFALKVLSFYPDSSEFRQVYARQLKIINIENSQIDDLITKSAILDGAKLEKAFDYLNIRLKLLVGSYAIHRMRRIIVRINEYIAKTDKFFLDDGAEGYQTNYITYVDQYEPLAQDDFSAQYKFEIDFLKKQANEDCCFSIKRYLTKNGKESNFKSFKEIYRGSIIEESQWAAWWKLTKIKLVRDPYIDLGEGAQPTLRLRETPRDYNQEMQADFDFAKGYERAAMPLKYMEQVGQGIPLNAEVLAHFLAGMEQDTQKGGEVAFASWLVLKRLQAPELVPAYNPEWLAAEKSFQTFILWTTWEQILIAPCLEFLPAVEDNYAIMFAHNLPNMPEAMVFKTVSILKKLDQPELFEKAADSYEHPHLELGEFYAAMWQILVTEGDLPFKNTKSLFKSTGDLFDLIGQYGNNFEKSVYNEGAIIATIRHAIANSHYKLAAQAFASFDASEISLLYKVVTSTPNVSAMMRSQLVQFLAK